VETPTAHVGNPCPPLQITDIHSDLDKADSTFRIVPALNGAPGAVSFEATNFKGHFRALLAA
jgi:hypothetical protein